MDAELAALFNDESNFRRRPQEFAPVYTYIEENFDDIERFLKNGGMVARVTDLIERKTGIKIDPRKFSAIKYNVKKRRLKRMSRPVQSTATPAATTTKPQDTAPNQNGNANRKRPLELRTSKNFVDVDITDL